MPTTADLMKRTLRKAFVADAVEGLFGSGPERAISAYASFWAPGTHPTTIVECPLMGEASYDVLVGSYGSSLRAAPRLPDAAPPACHAAFGWAASLDGGDIDLFFELDAQGPKGQHPGVHCRHWGDLDAADDFFRVMGEGWRAPLYRAAAERLPQGWRAVFAAVFAGRPGAPTRLELTLSKHERQAVGEDPARLRACFDHLGFEAYDAAMLEAVCRLAAMSRLDTLQFDIGDDGTLGTTFSITSCFERTGAGFHGLFQDDGDIGRICTTYEQMGISDGRWRLAEGAVFATKGIALVDGAMRHVTTVSIPNCGKAKWIDARLQPAKLYLLQGAFAEQEWGLGARG